MAPITVMQLISFIEVINHALIFFDSATGSGPYKDLLDSLIDASRNNTCYYDLKDNSTSRIIRETKSEDDFAVFLDLTGDQRQIISKSIAEAIGAWPRGVVVRITLDNCTAKPVEKPEELPSSFLYGHLCLQNESIGHAFYWSLPERREFHRLDFQEVNCPNCTNYQIFSSDTNNVGKLFSLNLPKTRCQINCILQENPMVNKDLQPACNHCKICVDCRYFTEFKKDTDRDKVKFCIGKKYKERSTYITVIDFGRYLLAIFICLAMRRVWTQGKNFDHVCLLFLGLSIRLVSVALEESPISELARITCLIVNLCDHLGFVAIMVDWPYRLLYYDKRTIEASNFELTWLWFNYSIPPIMTTILAFTSDIHCTNTRINIQLILQAFLCTAWLTIVVHRRRHYMNSCTLFISITNVYASSLAMATLIGGLTMETRLTTLVVCSVLAAKHYLEFKRQSYQESHYSPSTAGSNTGHENNNNNHHHLELWRIPSAAYVAAHLLFISEN